VSVASAHVAQFNGDGIDIEEIRRFADFAAQIAPAPGLTTEQQPDAGELQAATHNPAQDAGPFRKAIGRVLNALGAAGARLLRKRQPSRRAANSSVSWAMRSSGICRTD